MNVLKDSVSRLFFRLETGPFMYDGSNIDYLKSNVEVSENAVRACAAVSHSADSKCSM